MMAMAVVAPIWLVFACCSADSSGLLDSVELDAEQGSSEAASTVSENSSRLSSSPR